MLSDAAITIDNPNALDTYRNDGVHTIFMQGNDITLPFVNGGLYLLEVKPQAFTLRQNGFVQTMTRIFPVTGNIGAEAIKVMRTLYNSQKGSWITVC